MAERFYIGVRDTNGADREVGDQTPLPVAQAWRASETLPLSGSTSASGVIGPLSPDLGRPVWLTLSGTWSGTVTVKRSVDGGASKQALTLAGSPWAVFTANVQEPVAEESVSGAAYYLDVALSSGTLMYRMGQ